MPRKITLNPLKCQLALPYILLYGNTTTNLVS